MTAGALTPLKLDDHGPFRRADLRRLLHYALDAGDGEAEGALIELDVIAAHPSEVHGVPRASISGMLNVSMSSS